MARAQCMSTMMNGSLGRQKRLSRRCSAMNLRLIPSLLLSWCLFLVYLVQTKAEIDVSKVSVDKALDDLEAAAEATLADRTSNAIKYKELMSQVHELIEETRRMEELEKELVRRTLAVDDLIRKANAVQLKYLASQVNLTIEKELKERVAIEQESRTEEGDLSNAITLEQLQQHAQPIRIVEESEKQVEEWVLRVIDDEIAKFHAEAAEMCSSGKCVTPVEAAQLVQTSLTTFARDGTVMVDHTQGAKIVHELTSETYTPPADDPGQLIGNIWWRKYIPQDWERILPSQWEEWKAGLPSFLKHSLGLRSSETVPPEAILTASTVPGSCWAMAGRSGQVTVRLPYPVKVKAITIDHTSHLLVGPDMKSAPRSMRIIAYPPCDGCDGLGFDVAQAWELTAVVYDVEGRMTQTFDIPVPTSSCSEEAPSCEAEPDPIGKMHVSPAKDSFAAAITVAIEDNWGKDDYTCLYRFRIHGDVATAVT